MVLMFNGLLPVLFFTAVSCSLQSIHGVRWQPCQFIDEHAVRNEKGQMETKYIHRDAGLQFGQLGDSLVHPELITFLVTASKVDMRRYVKDEVDTIQCEVRRYSTGGFQKRWPGMGAQEQDLWFACTLRHAEGLFVITTFLRHSPSNPNALQPDFQHWTPVTDRDTVSTTAVMMVLSNTPSVEIGLLKEQTLNCEFALDHKSPGLTVEWHLQRIGDRSKLFTYDSGVSMKAITRGDASLKINSTKLTSEGTYMCVVHVPPLYGSQEIALHIMEPPRVSLSVSSEVSLVVGGEQKVVCEAVGYYPLDVHMEWLKKSLSPGASRMPEVLKVDMYSSHRRHQDGTYSVSAFFLLQPTLQDSGYRYTCRVSHVALRVPIRKSFTLSVTEEYSVMWYIFLIGLLMLALLCFKILAERQARKSKPY
ncbi:tapasin-related protein-like isoform X2 [Clupea harengus]|uniref:Tapasin-related protein-like isoform X2 n=1 Tax=Clupea harengus TaxID=7950 RepID=A0A6P8G1H6_CLUHA|nr:tapasin-related protein-like isoform X2 [Clupea harengus]